MTNTNTFTVKAIGTDGAESPLTERTIPRRHVLPHDIEIEIVYCGICHSDLHLIKNEWGSALYPMVPGHEIIGKITKVGANVSKHQIGDYVGVGCIVDSCRKCQHCKEGLEQYCEPGWTFVFNTPDEHTGATTYGGFSEKIVVDESYAVNVPKALQVPEAAPLLCGGITVYSPLRHWKAGPGKKVGILGIGGLGHLAIKMAKAMGAHVVVFTTSPSKVEDAKRLGADEAILSTIPSNLSSQSGFDMILDTVSAKHDVNTYLRMLKVDGSMVLVGLPPAPIEIQSHCILSGRKSFSGSNIGGIAETQEMMNFCAEKNIVADIELIKAEDVNMALERLEKNDVKYRFVIDMTTLNSSA